MGLSQDSLLGRDKGRRHDSGTVVDSGLLQELLHYKFGTGWDTLMRLWRPCLPFACPFTSALQRRSYDTSRGTVQQGHEPSQSFSGMAIWGHCKLLCIPRFQEKTCFRMNEEG